MSLFFQSTRTDQNSSLKFYEILWSQIESFGLANWTKKFCFSSFFAQHTMPGETKGPFFGFMNFFLKIKFYSKGTTLQFFDVLWQHGRWKISKGSHLQFFGIVGLFSKKSHQRVPLSIFWCFATMEVEKMRKGRPAIRSNFLAFSGIVEKNTLILWSPFAIFES